jgi:hypothetical protein
MNFVTVDAAKFSTVAGALGLQGDRFPAFVIHAVASDEMYPFDQRKDITKEGIEEFVDQYMQQKNGVSSVAVPMTTPDILAEPKVWNSPQACLSH